MGELSIHEPPEYCGAAIASLTGLWIEPFDIACHGEVDIGHIGHAATSRTSTATTM